MKKLDWNNYKEDRYLFAIHNRSGETVIAHFDSICIYWDFYFKKDGKVYKCTTNMNKDRVLNAFSVECEDDDSDSINKKLKKVVENIDGCKFAFLPEFENILMGGTW